MSRAWKIALLIGLVLLFGIFVLLAWNAAKGE